jgi:hypothetical protein
MSQTQNRRAFYEQLCGKISAEMQFTASWLEDLHGPSIGASREAMLRRFITSQLSRAYQCGTGFVVSESDGTLSPSRQCDIIIYNAMSSAPLYSDEAGTIVEAGQAHIVAEVKSLATKQNMADALRNVQAAKQVDRHLQGWVCFVAPETSSKQGAGADAAATQPQTLCRWLDDARKGCLQVASGEKDDQGAPKLEKLSLELADLPDLVWVLGGPVARLARPENASQGPQFYDLWEPETSGEGLMFLADWIRWSTKIRTSSQKEEAGEGLMPQFENYGEGKVSDRLELTQDPTAKEAVSNV